MTRDGTHQFVKALGASLILLLLVATCGPPAYARECEVEYDPYIVGLLHQLPGSYITDILIGDVLTRWMGVYNAAPPKTDTHADKVVVIAARVLGPTVLTLFVTDGCITEARRFEINAFEEMKAGGGTPV